jgi:hypothetical protein
MFTNEEELKRLKAEANQRFIDNSIIEGKSEKLVIIVK